MKRLLSTKILPESLQDKLRSSGWQLTQYNAISIELLPVVFRPQGNIAIFTSKHGVRACLSGKPDGDLSGATCLCVGATTASFIREHGGTVLEIASSATELASWISRKYTDQSFIYYCGNRRLNIIPEALERMSVSWEEVTAYHTQMVERAFDHPFEGILFFSPSGVKSYTSLNPLGEATAYCIGPTTAAEANKHTKKYKIAKSPDLEALVALVIKNTNPVKN
jgi:uroporphyrinogen-III synthase